VLFKKRKQHRRSEYQIRREIRREKEDENGAKAAKAEIF
jgi:hypothetical protein